MSSTARSSHSSRDPDPRTLVPLHARAPGRTVGLAAALILWLANPACLGYPPYWDGLVAVFHQAAWLHHHQLDLAGLVRDVPGYMAGGPRVYTTSIVPPLLALLAHVAPTPAAFLVLCHLLTLAAPPPGPGICSCANEPPVASAGGNALLVLNPFFMAQSWSLHLEIALTPPSCSRCWPSAAQLVAGRVAGRRCSRGRSRSPP